MRAVTSVVCVLLALASLSGVRAQTSAPSGLPMVDLTTTSSSVNTTYIKNAVAAYLKTTSTLSAWAGVINETAITLYDYTDANPTYSMNISININGPTNVNVYYAMQAMRDDLWVADAVLNSATYTTQSAHLVENPASSVSVFVSQMGSVYIGQWSAVYTISLSASPRVGTNVTIFIRPATSGVIYNTTKVVIKWPRISAGFRVRADDTVITSSTTHGIDVWKFEGSDNAGRYSTDTSVNTNVLTKLPFETIVATPLAADTRLYRQRTSGDWKLRALAHRDANFEAIVSIVTTPSTGLTVTPPNVTLTEANRDFTFTVRGNVNQYTIGYLIGHPYLDSFGNVIGKNNNDFNAISTTSTITVQPTMNVSVASLPDGFVVNPVASTVYGGAYSRGIPVHIERDPINSLTVTPTPQTGIEFFPASVTFHNGGVRSFTFRYRAHTQGIKTIAYTLTGPSAGDYFLKTPTRRWIVRGRNPVCFKRTTEVSCLATLACTWNAATGKCFNGTLPIGLSPIPLLFHQEESVPLNITLPTPVASGLTITFAASARFAFSPASIIMTPGQSTANFTITATMLTTDVGVTRQNFQLLLTGNDANTYDQERAYADVRPKVQCAVDPPTTGFFVGTWSDMFVIRCENTAPEEEVIFTPTSSISGVVFTAEQINTRDPNSVFFSPQNTTMRFYANSTNRVTGTATLNIAISGVNAQRYSPVPQTTFRVLESGVVVLPPTFHMTAYTTSELLHIDLSVPPPTPLNITMKVVNNDTTSAAANITLTPSIITFNNSVRGTFRVTAASIGWFYITFELNGEHVRNYINPTWVRVPIESKDPLDGSGFDARLKPGYLGHRKQCRVSVGFTSIRFRGQDPVDRVPDFCALHPTQTVLANETYDCAQHMTSERCQNVIATLGHACVWNQGACEFVAPMQGKILSFAYGAAFTAFLSLAGEVWTIGNTRYGQLGHYNTSVDKVPLPESIAVISAGSNHIMALSYSGAVYTWGANHKGQLGHQQRYQHTSVPVAINLPRGENITCISAGTLHNAALSMSGRLFMWGSNEFGQLGMKATFRSHLNAPQAIQRDAFGGDPVIAVTLGEFHSMVATANSAYTFGSNTMGQLGRQGYDEWQPAPPVLWRRDKFSKAPTWPSYLLGKDC